MSRGKLSRRNLHALRCEALFASPLEMSDHVAPSQVRQAIQQVLQLLGGSGCAACVAQAYGERPNDAVARMRWARARVAEAFTPVASL